jgi:hypothetical protein
MRWGARQATSLLFDTCSAAGAGHPWGVGSGECLRKTAHVTHGVGGVCKHRECIYHSMHAVCSWVCKHRPGGYIVALCVQRRGVVRWGVQAGSSAAF